MSRRRTVCKSDDGEDPKVIWLLMKEELVNQEYWTTNSSTTWDITAYDQSLSCKKLVNLRESHASLKQDISHILQAFIHHPAIIKSAKKLLKDLSNSSKNQTNAHFWTIIAPTLQQSHMDRCKLETQTEDAIVGINASVLTKHARQLQDNDEPHVLSSSLKKHKSSSLPEPSTSDASPTSSTSLLSELTTSTSTTHSVPVSTIASTPLSSDLVESDSIFSDSSNLSLSTIIKRKAVLLHDQYKSGEPLSARQRKIMSNGLSSILDLVDQSYPSQRSLFLRSEWHQINQLFAHKYTIPMVALDPVLDSTWKIICGTVNASRNIKTGLLYLYRIFGKHQYTNAMSSLKVYEHLLELLDQEGHLFYENTMDTTLASENDYLSYVWIPLWRRLLPNQFNIRIKSGETSSSYTTKAKQEMYPDSTNVGGFKVDLRLVVVKDGVEFDICSVEAACDSADDTKVISDEGKLAREVKDNLDCMLTMAIDNNNSNNNNNNSTTECTGWGIQITGISCCIMSLHLTDNGLYVALPRFDFTLPRSISGLLDFNTTVMPQLLTFRQQLVKSVDWIQKHAKTRRRRDSLNKMDDMTGLNTRQRGTWYTPPKDIESQHPINFTELRPLPPSRTNLNTTLLSIACESAFPDKKNSNDDTDADEFGWKYDGKRWRNVFTGESSDDGPYGVI